MLVVHGCVVGRMPKDKPVPPPLRLNTPAEASHANACSLAFSVAFGASAHILARPHSVESARELTVASECVCVRVCVSLHCKPHIAMHCVRASTLRAPCLFPSFTLCCSRSGARAASWRRRRRRRRQRPHAQKREESTVAAAAAGVDGATATAATAAAVATAAISVAAAAAAQ